MKIIECPRDAMQGIKEFIPTERKVAYLNEVLKIGFDTIDFGSFVSHQAIPQLRDTVQVLEQLDWNTSKSKLLAIVANLRGAQEASQYDAITFLGFPFSISETFQKRNTNKTITEAFNSLEAIQNVCAKSNKKLVVYISMGFGNPYGDPYDVPIVLQFVDILTTLGADVISLADTIGVSNPESITSLFSQLSVTYAEQEIGIHLHSNPQTSLEKIEAAFKAGCKRFDGALKGFGGCPMAKDELVGNLATEQIITYLQEQGVSLNFNKEALSNALLMVNEIFPKH